MVHQGLYNFSFLRDQIKPITFLRDQNQISLNFRDEIVPFLKFEGPKSKFSPIVKKERSIALF